MALKLTTRRGLLGTCALVLTITATGCASDGRSTAPVRPHGRSPEAVIGKVWQWESMVTPAETIEVPTPERYTVQLLPDGKVAAQLDCNRGRGGYLIDEGTISFSSVVSTRMACAPGSLDTRFARDLIRAKSFFVEDGKLHLELPADGGTMRFRAAN